MTSSYNPGSGFAGNGVPLNVTPFSINLAQNAGTYTAATATGGDVYIEIATAYVKTAATGLTSALIVTNHATAPKSIVASTLLASITGDASLTVVTTSFILPSTKAIQYTIVGTGSGGVITLVTKWSPVTAGATLV